jgi:DNA-binding transcriptional regulator GbsR (MarR family)
LTEQTESSNISDMTEEQSEFVEAMGRFLGATGMTPMAGRVWGWLLICEPPEQTAEQLAAALGASRGSISGTARILVTAGFIDRTTRRGDRREWFSVHPGALTALVDGAAGVYRRFREIAELGVRSVMDRPPESRARIEEVRDVTRFIEAEFPAVLARFHAQRVAGRTPPTRHDVSERKAS